MVFKVCKGMISCKAIHMDLLVTGTDTDAQVVSGVACVN